MYVFISNEISLEDIEQSLEEKAKVGKDMYDNPGEAMEASKNMSCEVGIHTHTVDGKEGFMPCKTHDEYEKIVNGTETD